MKKFGYYESLIFQHLPGSVGQRFMRIYDKHSVGLVKNIFAETINQLNDDSIVLDLGANLGKYTAIFAQKAGKVYAFEPDPWTFEQLKKNASVYDNVHFVQAAAGTTNKIITMYRGSNFDNDPGASSLSTSIYVDKKNVDRHNKFEVKQIDIVKFIQELDREIEIIKMDIEGAEVPVLESLLNSFVAERIRYIFVETHEFKIPGFLERTDALRRKIRKLSRPKVFLNWGYLKFD